MNPSACPSYDELIRYADTRRCGTLGGHDPRHCPACEKHLREYDEIRGALCELKGLEEYSAESLREDALGARKAEKAAVAPLPDNGAARVLELAAQARKSFQTDWAKARELSQEALRLARALPSPGNRREKVRADLAMAEATGVFGIYLTRTNRLTEGIATLMKAEAHWKSLGEPVGLGGTQANLAYALMINKDLAQAEVHARESIATLDAVGQEFELAQARHILAIILMEQKLYAAAKREIQDVILIFRKQDKSNELAKALHLEGEISLEMGDPFFTAAAAPQAAVVFARLGNALDEARCIWLLGRAQIAGAGDRAEGLANLERARRRFSSEGLWIEAGMILCQSGQALIEGGDRAAARARLIELARQLPADQANSWVSEAARALRQRLAEGDMASLAADFGRLAGALERLNAALSDITGAAH